MRKLLVWIGGGLVALVAIVAGVAAFALSQFDAEAEISRQVQAATGRAFVIGGGADVSLLPTLGFTARDVRLANAPGGGAADMVAAEVLRVSVAIKPLFDRRIEVREFTLERAAIALEIGADGKPNWMFAPATPATSTPTGGPLGGFEDLQLDAVRLVDSKITYVDLKAGAAPIVLDAVRAQTALSGLDSPLAIDGSAMKDQEPLELKLTFATARALLMGQVTPLRMQLASQPVNVSLDGQFNAANGDTSGALDARGPSLRRLAAWGGAPLPEGPGLGDFAVTGNLAITPKEIALLGARFSVDAINGVGDLRLRFGGARPLIAGKAQLAALDLNPYLQQPATTPGGAAGTVIAPVDVDAPGGWSAQPMDLAGLRAMDADLELSFGPLTFQKIRAERGAASVALAGGLLTVGLSELALYGGAGRATLMVDARGETVGIRQDIALQNVAAETLLADAAGLKALEGLMTLNLALTGEGISQKELFAALDGQAQFQFANGALRGVNLGGISRTIGEALTGEFIGPNAKTAFTAFGARFSLADGVATTQDFKLRAEGFEVAAKGAIDIGAQRLKLDITPKSESALARVGVAGAGIVAPFRIEGAWGDLDFEPLILESARAAVEAEAGRVTDSLADRINQGLQRLPFAPPRSE